MSLSFPFSLSASAYPLFSWLFRQRRPLVEVSPTHTVPRFLGRLPGSPSLVSRLFLFLFRRIGCIDVSVANDQILIVIRIG